MNRPADGHRVIHHLLDARRSTTSIARLVGAARYAHGSNRSESSSRSSRSAESCKNDLNGLNGLNANLYHHS